MFPFIQNHGCGFRAWDWRWSITSCWKTVSVTSSGGYMQICDKRIWIIDASERGTLQQRTKCTCRVMHKCLPVCILSQKGLTSKFPLFHRDTCRLRVSHRWYPESADLSDHWHMALIGARQKRSMVEILDCTRSAVGHSSSCEEKINPRNSTCMTDGGSRPGAPALQST